MTVISSTAHREKVLFVDDDPQILTSFRRTLNGKFDISTAISGKDALELMEDQEFAVVVSDLSMPEMDGIALLGEVRSRHPETVRVVLTGYGTLDNALHSVNEGYIFTFLSKPCTPKEMERVLDNAIAQFNYRKNLHEITALKRIKKAMEGVIIGFSALVEARDPYTAGHQRSVTELCMAVADKMELDKERKEGLKYAAMVHDIGKLYVPSEFLNRPGRLTNVEFSVIKAHPQVGADILRPVDFPWPVGNIVLQHHERLDGSGYPRGLGGDAILLETRILSAADVVDAMCFHRPYRPALGIDRALEELEKGKNRLFDPEVVEAMVSLFESGEYSISRFADHHSPPIRPDVL